MAHFGPLWQQAGSYSASADRQLIAALWPAGGASAGAVTAVNNTMTVSVAPGYAAVPLASGQGSALCRWDAAEVVSVTASPPSGQSRIDLVVVQVRDNQLDAGPNNDFVLQVVAGVAAATPAVPASPANALALAQVLVPGTVANLNTATIVSRALPLAGGLLGRTLLDPTTQAQVTVGGSWNVWDATFALSFVAPASGAVILEAEYGLVVPAGGTMQAGWNGGGIGNGIGPGLCPIVYVAQAVGQQFGLSRVHTSHLITGLVAGQVYTPAYWQAANAQPATIYYGGSGTGGNFTNNAGPVLLTARAA